MNENAKKWVEALRSDEFEQTDGTLRNRAGFCCLGVACELYRRETRDGRWVFQPAYGQHTFRLGPGDLVGDVLPPKVRHWLGLTNDRGDMDGADGLADINDAGNSFTYIADVIEEEPAGLFAPSPTEEGQDA